MIATLSGSESRLLSVVGSTRYDVGGSASRATRWSRRRGWDGVLYSYDVALLDNALLEPLAQACAEERRYEFMFMALPLKIALF